MEAPYDSKTVMLKHLKTETAARLDDLLSIPKKAVKEKL
jgi:hypothetical protein